MSCQVWRWTLCHLALLFLFSCYNFLYASPAHDSLPFHAQQSRSGFFVKDWRPLKWRRVQLRNWYTQVNTSHRLQAHYFSVAKQKVFERSYECRKSHMKRKMEENPFAWAQDFCCLCTGLCRHQLFLLTVDTLCVGEVLQTKQVVDRMQVDSFAASYRWICRFRCWHDDTKS